MDKLFIHNLYSLINNTEGRIDWDEYFMSMSLLISIRSSCDRLHVGCILVNDRRVISSGYNGFLPGHPHKSIVIDNHEQCTVHAEQNAISDAAKRGISLNGSTAYITHFPCITCTKLLISSGICEIKYLNDYKNNDLVYEFLLQSNIPITKFKK